MIRPWKNDGKKGNENLRLFRIRFSWKVYRWIIDLEEGTHWGFNDSSVDSYLKHKEV